MSCELIVCTTRLACILLGLLLLAGSACADCVQEIVHLKVKYVTLISLNRGLDGCSPCCNGITRYLQ